MSNEDYNKDEHLIKEKHLIKEDSLIDRTSNNQIESGTNSDKFRFAIIIGNAFVIFLMILILITYLIRSYNFEIVLHSDQIIKSGLDKKEYSIIVLNNGLTATLIYQPDISISSAALSVLSGSLNEPEDFPGLAHLTEHMVFLGTKKYPETSGFDSFLNSNLGSSNAFTEEDKTTYFYNINDDKFLEALDMFANMFIEPLFDIKSLDKEINAVNSENQKDSNLFSNQEEMVFKTFAEKPYSKFTVGSNESLRHSGLEKLQEELKTYFNKNYYAENMRLTIICSEKIPNQMKIVSKIFSEIKSKKLIKNQIEERKDENLKIFKKENLGKLTYIKNNSQTPTLDFFFVLDPVKHLNKVKPIEYISYLISYKGKGSLFKVLFDKDLILEINLGKFESIRKIEIFNISFKLTEKGFNNSIETQEIVYAYLDFLIKNPDSVSKSIYDELDTINYNQFQFLEEPSDYTQFVTDISNSSFDLEYKNYIDYNYNYGQFDKDIIKDILNKFTKENSIIILSCSQNPSSIKELDNINFIKEKTYGTEFKAINLDQLDYNYYHEKFIKEDKKVNRIIFKLRKNLDYTPPNRKYSVNLNKGNSKMLFRLMKYFSKLNDHKSFLKNNFFNFKSLNTMQIDRNYNFQLRSKNEFAEIQQFMPNCQKKRKLRHEKEIECFNDQKLTEPNLLLKSNIGVFYSFLDNSFNIPKSTIILNYYSTIIFNNEKNYVNYLVLSNILNSKLEPLFNDFMETGNKFSLNFSNNGMMLTLAFYSSHSKKISKKISEELIDKIENINEKQYKQFLLENLIQDLVDSQKINPLSKAKEYLNSLIYDKYFSNVQILNYFSSDTKKHEEIKKDFETKLDFKSFKDFANQFFANLYSKILIAGVLTDNQLSEVKENFVKFEEKLKAIKIKSRINSKEAIDYIDISKQIQKVKEIKPKQVYNINQINSFNEELNNGLLNIFIVYDKNDFKKKIYFSLVEQILQDKFFEILRTVHQFGYTSYGRSKKFNNDVLGYIIGVQGDKAYPSVINTEADRVLQTYFKKLEEFTLEDFEKLKNNVSSYLGTNFSNPVDKYWFYWEEIYNNRLNFKVNDEMSSKLQEATLAELKIFYEDIFIINPIKLSIQLTSKKFIEKNKGSNEETSSYLLNKDIIVKEVKNTSDIDFIKVN